MKGIIDFKVIEQPKNFAENFLIYSAASDQCVEFLVIHTLVAFN